MASASPQVTPKHFLLALGAAATLVGLAAPEARAILVTDVSYFNNIPNNVSIHFENTASGSPISLIAGARLPMPANAYASLGVTMSGTGLSWAYDANPALHAALIIGGTPNNSIPSSLCNQFTLTFAQPVQAVGFFVVNNRTADPNGPTFIARDSAGNVIDTAQFDSKFIDGSLSTINTTADYGFMGLAAPTPMISTLTVTKQAAIFDDLIFGPHLVPAPGALALGAAGALVLLRRRR